MKLCNELLWESGIPRAVCKEPFGWEHDHSDRTIQQRLDTGAATPFDGSDIEFVAEIWMVNGEIEDIRVIGEL